MNARIFAVVLAVILLCGAASAQNYSIRVTYNTNLRISNSLQSNIFETVGSGSTLDVVGNNGRWLRINRIGNEVWMAGWVSHSRVAETAPTQPQTTTNIDNCCFVDRQCATDQEWADGYWAFQNAQCAAPVQTQTQTQTSTQTTSTASPQFNNCCFVDRDCTTDQEWKDGHAAWVRSECDLAVDNCCQVGWECYSDADRLAGFNAWRNFGCPAGKPLQTQVSTQPVTTTAPVTITIPAGVDNCCQVNRQCHSDDDWVRGFHDFQDNQCAGVAPTSSISPITGPIPEGVDNCCFLNRQCHSEQDYVIGYEQFKYGVCHVPDIAGVINIAGSGAFVGKARQALRLMVDRAPKWYRYVQSTLRGVKEIPMGGDSGIFPEEAVYRSWPNFRSNRTGEGHVIWVAGQLVHEACHVHRYKAGLESGGYAGEKACTEIQIQALDDIDSGYDVAASRRRALARIDDPAHQWWRFH